MTSLEDRLDISTPENVVFGYQIAGIGSRFLAALIDSLIIMLLVVAVYTALFMFLALFELESGEPAVGWALALFSLMAFIILWGYYIFFEILWNGQSPGKRRIGLRVIQSDGAPVSLSGSAIRNLIRLVDFLPVYYGLGVMTMFIDRRARRLGDLVAGTLVVHDRDRNISLEEVLPRQPRFYRYEIERMPAVELPVERLNKQEVGMIEEFLHRQQALHNSGPLAQQLLQYLSQRMEIAAPDVNDREAIHLLAQILEQKRG